MANKKIEKKDDILLSEEDVNYALTFAQALSGYSIYGNAISPVLVNQRMKELNLNPLQATEDTLTKALQNPRDSELALQSFSQDFENQSQIYKKVLDYSGTMLSFDLTYDCANAKYADYTSNAYQKDLDILKDFVYKFDYRTEFTNVVQELLRSEAYFGVPRFDSDRITLQELPASPSYTLINGKWAYGLLFAFNFYYFMIPGVDIDLYPDFFKSKFNEFMQPGKIPPYNPSLSPEIRGESSWIYWRDIPVDVGWCWKFNPNMAARLPVYSGLFLDIIQQPFMRALQKNINMATASKIIAGEIPLLSKTQAGVRDSFAVSSKNLGEFLSLIKSAIGDSLRAVTAPLTNIQGISFPSDNIYNPYLKSALATSGINTSLIFTSDVRPNIMESQLSLNVDENLMIGLYPQFEKFMNYQINKQTKKFKFNIKFQGTKFFNNRQMRFEKITALMAQGVVLNQQLAASMGFNIFELQHELDEARANGWVDKLTPIISAFQQSGKDNGRPTKKSGDLSDSGADTQANGGNIEKNNT